MLFMCVQKAKAHWEKPAVVNPDANGEEGHIFMV